MKEATKSPSMGAIGELNATVISVVAIGAVALFFNLFVWPSIKTNVLNSTKCASVTNCECIGKTCECTYFSGNKAQEVTCPNNSIRK